MICQSKIYSRRIYNVEYAKLSFDRKSLDLDIGKFTNYNVFDFILIIMIKKRQFTSKNNTI
jgi:hypothetical protein